jgi:diadenosine tetraphosphatase ApaH/serine/threonine PP2A family protein phosphatase
MRYAIISDIHSNLEALQAVLEDIAGQAVDQVLCLGDVVGYGADPNECVRLVRDRAAHIVAGNHDHAAVGKTDISYFNPHAKRAVSWTAKTLMLEHARFLCGLPYTLKLEGLFLVHATPSDPPAWNYLLSARVAEAEFAEFEEPVCLIGHSHQPLIFSSGDGTRPWRGEKLTCSPDQRYIVNVGSVGQPRDGDPRACYALVDTAGKTLQLRRVRYDVRAAQRKILQAGLPPVLAVRLANGE